MLYHHYYIHPWFYCPYAELIKFDDEITVTCLITNDDKSNHCNEIEPLEKWNNDNNFILNDVKTKELIVDVRKCRNFKDSIVINGSSAEQVHIYKFLGLTVMNTLP